MSHRIARAGQLGAETALDHLRVRHGGDPLVLGGDAQRGRLARAENQLRLLEVERALERARHLTPLDAVQAIRRWPRL